MWKGENVMYEYHGWATVRASASFDDDIDEAPIVQEIQDYIHELNWTSGVLDIRVVNGDFQVWIAGLDNHKPSEKYDPIEIFKKIGDAAPGSYGILYIRDGDDVESFNIFKVYTLIRGEVKGHDDPFLSPFIPKLEDPDPGCLSES